MNDDLIVNHRQFLIKSDNHVKIIVKKILNSIESRDERKDYASCKKEPPNEPKGTICNNCQYVNHVLKIF